MPLYADDEAFQQGIQKALLLLDSHYEAFRTAKTFADETGHTVPCDTKSWSQILVSVLTGLSGRNRQKGSDLGDGSDVKAANVWDAIDTPRFNGAIPAGRTTAAAQKPADVTALDSTPYVFFVLWDTKPRVLLARCRIWVVRTQFDTDFRAMAAAWYAARASGRITSTNFQLHPPRNLDSNVFRNTFGNLEYPLLFSAVRMEDHYETEYFDRHVLTNGSCVKHL
jgi:hypothetical protein